MRRDRSLSPRRVRQRLLDILDAADRIESFTAGGFPDPSRIDPVWDAILFNLTVIGEAIKAIPPEVQEMSSDVDWSSIAKMRDFIVHHYFDTERSIIRRTVEEDLPRMRQSIEALLAELGDAEQAND